MTEITKNVCVIWTFDRRCPFTFWSKLISIILIITITYFTTTLIFWTIKKWNRIARVWIIKIKLIHHKVTSSHSLLHYYQSALLLSLSSQKHTLKAQNIPLSPDNVIYWQDVRSSIVGCRILSPEIFFICNCFWGSIILGSRIFDPEDARILNPGPFFL